MSQMRLNLSVHPKNIAAEPLQTTSFALIFAKFLRIIDRETQFRPDSTSICPVRAGTIFRLQPRDEPKYCPPDIQE